MLLTQLLKIASFALAAGKGKNVSSFTRNKLILLFLSLVLLSNSYDVRTNPRPNLNTSCSCGVCYEQVTWEDDGLACDHCQHWYHIDCQGVSQNMCNILGSNDISWCCIDCGVPNFATGIFDTFNVNTSSTFSSLSNLTSDESTFMSSSTSVPDSLLSSGSPIATSSPKSNAEFFPLEFEVYRKERIGKGGGGVFLAINSKFMSTVDTDLDTDCELLWARVKMRGHKDLCIGTFYGPPGNAESLAQLEASLSRMSSTTNVHIILAGDFNLAVIDWETNK